MNKFEAENAAFDKAARVQQAHTMFAADYKLKGESTTEDALTLGLKKVPEKKGGIIAIIKNIFS